MDSAEIQMIREGQYDYMTSSSLQRSNSLLYRGQFRYLPKSLKSNRRPASFCASTAAAESNQTHDVIRHNNNNSNKRKSVTLSRSAVNNFNVDNKQKRLSDPLDDNSSIDGLIDMGLHVDQQSLLLFSVIINDDLESLKKLYRTKRIVSLDRRGNTALHIAAQSGHVNILK